MAVILLAAVGNTGGERAAAEICVFDFTTVRGTGKFEDLTFATFHEAVLDSDPSSEDISALYDDPVFSNMVRGIDSDSKSKGRVDADQSLRLVETMLWMNVGYKR